MAAEALAVPAVVDRAHLPVLALAPVVARRVELPRLAGLLPLLLARAHLPVPAVPPARAVPVPLVLAGRPVLVAEPEVLLHLLSPRSCSAAMARSSPCPAGPTSEPVPRSR